MVDTLKSLSVLSRKVNQSSDRINTIITTLNQKLADMNFGLQVWLNSHYLEEGDYSPLYPGQDAPLPTEKPVSYLGYCRFENGWELAVKCGREVREWNKDEQEEETRDVMDEIKPLLKATRQERVKALKLIPLLLDQIEEEANGVLGSIDEAEKAVANL